MSQLSDIINQINQLSGYNVPTASNIIISQSATPVGSGSVNQIVDYINGLTGFSIPSTNVQYVSGSNVASPIVVYMNPAPGGTIPTDGIQPGSIIRADHILRIIYALSGVAVDDIIISGSLSTSGSNTFNGALSLPFIADNQFLYTSGGRVIGAMLPPSASYAATASYAPDYLLISDTGSFATTGSNNFNGNQSIIGNLLITGSDYINSSILFVSGASITTAGPNIDMTAGPGGWSELGSNNGENYVWVEDEYVYIATNWASGAHVWTFNRSGSLTAGGNINMGGFWITGSLFGTASWAQNAVSASYFSGSISNAIYAETSSYARTASYIDPANLPALQSYQITTGSITASVSTTVDQIFLIKSGNNIVVKVDDTGSIATSGSITINTTGSYNKLLSVNNNQKEYLSVNGEGVVVLNQFTTPPTAVTGGLYLDAVGDFYFGV